LPFRLSPLRFSSWFFFHRNPKQPQFVRQKSQPSFDLLDLCGVIVAGESRHATLVMTLDAGRTDASQGFGNCARGIAASQCRRRYYFYERSLTDFASWTPVQEWDCAATYAMWQLTHF
jgi:hypothetical protein